jgi:hypothetical protein
MNSREIAKTAILSPLLAYRTDMNSQNFSANPQKTEQRKLRGNDSLFLASGHGLRVRLGDFYASDTSTKRE